jgi:hypothetical protein
MDHLADGTLRRLVDDRESLDGEQGSHLASCDACRSKLTTIVDDAGRTEAAFRRALTADASGIDCEPVDTSRAWRSVSSRLAPRRSVLLTGPWLIAACAAAVAVCVLVFTPVGTFAQNFLTIFEPEQFVALPVSRSEIVSLPDLSRFGTMAQRVAPQVRDVSGAAAAGALAGFAVEVPTWLPNGTPSGARYAVTSGSDSTFTFSARKMWAAAPSGRPEPRMPRALDGATLELQTRPAVIVAFGEPAGTLQKTEPPARRDAHDDASRERDFPPLVVVQAPVPSVTSTGATVAEIEAYLLEQPGVSPALAAQIRAIGDPATTVPIPIPIDRAFGQRVRVQGVDGLGIGDDTGVGGIVIWQKNGMIYGVAGQLRQRDILAIAESLR